MPILNWEVISSSNVASFLTVMTHNSPVNFKFIHFLLWIKGSHQSLNFETFKCSDENLPNSSCHFSTHKSFFFQILQHTPLSWKTASLYFFSLNLICFGQSSPLNCKFLGLSSARVKIRQISYVNFETTSQFLFKFFIILQCYIHHSVFF